MKTQKKLTFSLFMAIGMQSSLLLAQHHEHKEATLARPASGWNPVKMADDGSNEKNGVEFYSHKGECNSQKVTFARLINKNAYAVKISYQVSPESPVVNVMVPASASIEGSCEATGGNSAKLIINTPSSKTLDEKQQNKDFMRSHVTVTKME